MVGSWVDGCGCAAMVMSACWLCVVVSLFFFFVVIVFLVIVDVCWCGDGAVFLSLGTIDAGSMVTFLGWGR